MISQVGSQGLLQEEMVMKIKKFKRAISIFSVMALTSTLIVNSQSVAEAADVTKTVTVLDPSGNPYQGALVAVGYSSLAAGVDKITLTSNQTSDSSGIATVVIPENAYEAGLFVSPRAGDTSTAVYFNWNIDRTTSGNVTVNLKAANLVVRIKKSDATTDAARGTWMWSRSINGSVEILRTGDLGINIPDSAPLNVCAPFTFGAGDDVYDNVRRIYYFKPVTVSSSRVIQLFSDSGCTSAVSKTAGAYQVSLNGTNVGGLVKASDGTPINFAANEVMLVDVHKIDANGFPVNNTSSVQYVSPSGEWHANVDTSVSGKYEVNFSSPNSLTIPSFRGGYFWVTAGGKFSTSADGSSPTDTFSANYNAATPNLKLKTTVAGTSTTPPTQFYFQKQDGSGNWQNIAIQGNSVTGLASFSLADGSYRVQLDQQFISGDWVHYSASVTISGSGSSATVTSLDGSLVSQSGGVWTITGNASNSNFKIVDGSGNAAVSAASGSYGGYIVYCLISGVSQNCMKNSNINSSGTTSTYLADGSYRLYVRPDTSGDFASKTFTATVASGTITVSGATNVGGVWQLPVPTSNAKIFLTNPTSSVPLNSGWVSVQKVSDVSWQDNADIDGRNPGLVNAYLPDGTFKLYANADSGDPSNVGLAEKIFDATVTGGVVVIKFNGTEAPKSNGRYVLSPTSSNFDVKLVDLAGAALTNSWFDICQDYGGGTTRDCTGKGIDQNGNASAFLANGNWIIRVNPGSSYSISQKSYSVTVTAGVATVTGASQVDGRWVLTGAAPNISGLFKDAAGSSNISFTGNQGMSINLQKWMSDHWEWVGSGSWRQTANWAMKVTGTGKYRVIANPQNFSDLSQSYSAEFWVDGSNKVCLTSNGTFVDSLTAVNISMKTSNLKLKVLNPLDNSLLSGGWVDISKIDGSNRNWVMNADINPNNPGITGAFLSDAGEYVLRVNPPQGSQAIVGLAGREYRAVVNSVDSVTVTLNGTAVATDSGRFVLSPASANITARIVKSDGVTPFVQSPTTNANVNVQKWSAERSNWDWIGNYTWANQDGYVSLSLATAGKYRLRIEPQGDSGVSVSYSQEFTIAAGEENTFTKSFGNITLIGPSIKVSMVANGSSTPLTYAGIEIRKNGQWIDWANTLGAGIASISLPSEGEYEFIVNPPQDQVATSSRKSYLVTATKSTDGVVTAVAKTATGASVNGSGVTVLTLGSPTLAGVVKTPDGAAIANSQVYPINVTTGMEQWEYSANSNSSGQWSMSLPAGTYKIVARAPWGTSTYGNSDPIGSVIVDASGVATTLPGGKTADAFDINLKNPTWSGTIKSPDGSAVVPNARICLRISQVWNCTNAASDGTWGLSAPVGFTNWTGITDAYLEVNDDFGRQYTQYRTTTISDVTTKLGNSGSGIVINLSAPNAQITVTAGGAPVANIWVNAERDNVGWLGGALTDANGIARFYIASLVDSFRVRADVGSNPSIATSYSSTQKTVAGTGGATVSDTLVLNTPNFRIVVREPKADGSVGPVIQNSWVDLYNESTDIWMGGSNTGSDGLATFKLDAPVSGTTEFTMSANPSWNATTNYSRTQYTVTINSSSQITVTPKGSTSAVSTEVLGSFTPYSLTLGLPSITGTVVNPSETPVVNSWVVPIGSSTGEYFWQLGANSRGDGSFGLNVPSGTYKVEANVPWGVSDLAKSATCSVTVANGAVTTSSGGCVKPDKSIQLALRAPNLTFTLKNDGVAVPNANVSISVGKWSTSAQSNGTGQVAFFIDADAIRTLNATSSSQPIYVWVNPPYGSSTVATWNCVSGDATKPICSTLVAVPATGSYPTSALGDIQVSKPNTKVRITMPDASSAQNSWVVIWSIKPSDPNYGKQWLGGANTDADGYAAFNVDTATANAAGATYVVEVNAPWNKRAYFATKEYTNSGTGLAWSAVNNQTFSPATPNLKITVKSPDETEVSKYGNVSIIEVNNSNQYVSWVGGYGLDDKGVVSVNLAASKRYIITANPGPGRPGVQTNCTVTTNASSPAVVSLVSGSCSTGTLATSALTLALNGGNVVGTITGPTGAAVVGAVVYANVTGATDETFTVITSTSASGRYGLQLDPTKSWTIRILPMNKPDDPAPLASYTFASFTPSGPTTTKNASLAAR
jgi:hypothetical protein